VAGEVTPVTDGRSLIDALVVSSAYNNHGDSVLAINFIGDALQDAVGPRQLR